MLIDSDARLQMLSKMKLKLSLALKLLSVLALIGMFYTLYGTICQTSYPQDSTGDLDIYIIFKDFNPNERAVTYYLQVQVRSAVNVSRIELRVDTSFDSQIHILQKTTFMGPDRFAYGNITTPITDKISGAAEFFPYDTYWTTLRYNFLQPNAPYRLQDQPEPSLHTFIEYPRNLGWQASVRYQTYDNVFPEIYVEITRSPGSSLITMLPI